MTASHTISNSVATDTGGEDGTISGALRMNPIQPVYEDELTGAYTQVNVPGILVPNPVATAKERKFNNATSRLLGDIYAQWEIIPDLRLKVSLGTDIMYHKTNRYTPSTIYQANGTATAQIGINKSINWLNENTLTWNKTFAEDHDLNLLGGFTMQKNNTEYVMASSSNFVNDVMEYNNLGAGSVYNKPESNAMQWSLMSYLARVNYTLKHKYLFSVNARVDGSSRFGANNKYGFFPSASAGWRISEEAFMEPVKETISNLKLRASYGETGNNNIGNYAHIATIDYESYVLADKGVGGFAPANIENALLTWEKQRAFNVGLDVSVFNSRVNLTADYFITRNHNLLLNVYVPQITGFNTSLQNIGEVENRGWELTLSTLNLKGAFEWTTDFNISSFKNKVLKLGPDGAPIIGTNHITEIGQPMGMFYGYITDGVFMNQAELDAGPIWAPGSSDRSHVGDVRFKDVSGPDGVPDGVINTYDKTIMGSPYPKAYFGMTNSFSYKNFGLSIALQGSFGNKVFNSSDAQLYTRARYKQYESVKNYWVSEEQPGDGESPRPNNLPTGGVREKSTRYLDNGSYLKVNNINFSYDFPTQLISKAGMSALKLYLTLTNPFIITKFRDFNPEVGDGNNPLTPGVMNYNYPLAKSAIIGINVSF